MLWGQGKLEEAEPILRESAQWAKATRPGTRVHVRSLYWLASVLAEQKKWPQASEVLREARVEGRAKLGINHPQMWGVVQLHAWVLRTSGADEELAKLETDVMAALTAVAQRPASTYAALLNRANARAELGQLAEAADDLAACLALDPYDNEVWFLRSALLAYLGQCDAYERHCCAMLERFGTPSSAGEVDKTVKSYLLTPRPPADCRRVMPLVELQSPDRLPPQWERFLKGLAAYRTDRLDEAVRWLNEARQTASGWPAGLASAELLLAMSHHRRGDADAAQVAMRRAMDLIDRHVPPPGEARLDAAPMHNRLMCHILLREALTILPLDAAATRPASTLPR
jgi:tetratricopeptide (TPR) repeat protein